jgi:hypothetical protein
VIPPIKAPPATAATAKNSTNGREYELGPGRAATEPARTTAVADANAGPRTPDESLTSTLTGKDPGFGIGQSNTVPVGPTQF